jgi:hypothetical protein
MPGSPYSLPPTARQSTSCISVTDRTPYYSEKIGPSGDGPSVGGQEYG